MLYFKYTSAVSSEAEKLLLTVGTVDSLRNVIVIIAKLLDVG